MDVKSHVYIEEKRYLYLKICAWMSKSHVYIEERRYLYMKMPGYGPADASPPEAQIRDLVDLQNSSIFMVSKPVLKHARNELFFLCFVNFLADRGGDPYVRSATFEKHDNSVKIEDRTLNIRKLIKYTYIHSDF